MKSQVHPASKTTVEKWQGNPSIFVSPATRRFLNEDIFRTALLQHRDLGSLPYSFRGKGGRKIMAVTTADKRWTFFILPDECEDYHKKWDLRELDEAMVNKF